MPNLIRLRLFSWVVWLLGIVIGTYGYFWYVGSGQPENLWPGLPLMVNWGSAIALAGLGFVLIVTHCLAAAGQATSEDFSMLCIFSIVSFFMTLYYWTDTGIGVLQGLLVLLVILSLEFLYPNWVGSLALKVRNAVGK